MCYKYFQMYFTATHNNSVLVNFFTAAPLVEAWIHFAVAMSHFLGIFGFPGITFLATSFGQLGLCCFPCVLQVSFVVVPADKVGCLVPHVH